MTVRLEPDKFYPPERYWVHFGRLSQGVIVTYRLAIVGLTLCTAFC